MSNLVSTDGERRGRKERECSNGQKPQADRLVGLNVKTRLRTYELERLCFHPVFGPGTHHSFPSFAL